MWETVNCGDKDCTACNRAFPRPQRFYIRNYDNGTPGSRWYVFMGDKTLEAQGQGLLVQEVGYHAAAEAQVEIYTQQFNRMVQHEQEGKL
jgi:hypothetical protein